MIGVYFNPADLQEPDRTWWLQWQKRADDATDKAIQAFETWLAGDRKQPFQCKFNNDIWKDLKNWLMKRVFYRKCAYCERIISGAHGDAEHFRPKGAVKYKDEDCFVKPSFKILNPLTNEELALDHPGYFWLAYNWRNLVPACEFCNSGLGKNERFDIQQTVYQVLVKLSQADIDALSDEHRPRPSKLWPGYYYPTPGALDQLEQPLLLNPLNPTDDRDPRKHLCFGVRGTVAALKKSPVGIANIDVFLLRDEDLRIDRQKAQEDFCDKYFDGLRELDPDNPGLSKGEVLLKEYANGKYPFSAAALDYHTLLMASLNKRP